MFFSHVGLLYFLLSIADEEAKSWGNIDAFDRVKRVNKGIHSWYLGSRSRKDWRSRPTWAT